jgi:hypothetical protein
MIAGVLDNATDGANYQRWFRQSARVSLELALANQGTK